MNQCLNKPGFKNILFFSVLVTALLSACHSENKTPAEKTATQPAEVSAVEVFPVQKGRLFSSLQIPGELIAYQQVDLYAKENSFVKKLYVDVGSEVKTGQLLVTMEAQEMGSQLAGALSDIKSREAIY